MALWKVASAWAETAYDEMLQDPKTECDIDSFVNKNGTNNKNPCNKIKVAMAHKLRVKGRKARLTPIPLVCTKSPHVAGLYVSRNAATKAKATAEGEETVVPLNDLLPRLTEDGKLDKTDISTTKKPTVVVATIRMGFGHHRLAYSACSWALGEGYTTIFHDLLNIESEESNLINSIDELYSKFSRLASELGGPIELLWGQAMKQGDANALRIAALGAAHLQPLLLAYPKDVPIIATHQLVALTCAAAGFTNVYNLVVDNYPQWFLVVPKTMNLTQGPVNYQAFLRMGVPAGQLKNAGHWCPRELVDNIPEDCARRLERLGSGDSTSSTSIKPRRLLIPVGGAGAQRKFIVEFVAAVADLVKSGKLQLFLNAGDHKHMKAAFVDVLTKCSLDYDTVTTTQGVYDFQKHLLQNVSNEPKSAITLFCFDEYFPAVATTDILCRVSDVLTCKPSELAFYPIPKLHIRRVGDHEADSARRAAEVGDGSMEAREIPDALEYLDLMIAKRSELLTSMNEAIVTNHTQQGMYDGCKNAVKWAVEGSK
eukprot:CAMPEP_0117004372 /NCGR_PEP_ID=MMETSP0472-20121206/5369_1 /TAXON_ID=693140 ORGANISM="Tiarina fusus, Strain LIS" /NCGR_SAMPLE_ID=MMETSP0472 /ASSEMBLY_ACC=CAM_ASM_000603 /LENGTH=539 /DNA_ID=CAMNT_0004705309 /DNA_START=247 /DNA_END=1866 /DNA_ORIENTATION=-